MDGSCIAQIFLLRKLNALEKTQCAVMTKLTYPRKQTAQLYKTDLLLDMNTKLNKITRLTCSSIIV